MAYYLYMDGVDDYFRVYDPYMVQGDEIVIDMMVTTHMNWKTYVEISGTRVNHTGSNTDTIVNASAVYVDGVQVTSNTPFIPEDTRIQLRVLLSTPAIGHYLFIFCNQLGGSNVQGNLYDVKVYNGGVLAHHYDLASGSTDDIISGEHATVYGGTWINETPSPTYPIVSISSVDKYKISDEVGVDRSVVTFSFDKDVSEYIVRAMGTSYDTGLLIEQKSYTVEGLSTTTTQEASTQTVSETTQLDAGVQAQVEIDHTELYQEGMNRINIYGKSMDGNWTPYNQE